MRIAVTSDELNVSASLGRCASYMCYTVDCGVITQCQNFPNPNLPPAPTVHLLQNLGVDLVISNSVESNIEQALVDGGVEVIKGVTGTARDAVESYISELLSGADEFTNEEENVSQM